MLHHHPPPPRGTPAAIRADHLTTILAAHKLRRRTQGRTCLLAALTAAPLLQVDCHHRPPRTTELDAARRHGTLTTYLSPLQRGHIHGVAARTHRQHGRAEVLRTWGTGISVLKLEPRHVLHGGQP